MFMTNTCTNPISPDPEWQSVLYLLTTPLVRERAARFVDLDRRAVGFAGLAEAAAAWSSSERLLVQIAQQLWSGDGTVSLRSVAVTLDEANFERVITALRIRRGQADHCQPPSPIHAARTRATVAP